MSYLAEQNVIGSLLMDADCISKICTRLSPDMFESEILSAIYSEFLRGYENNYMVNLVVLMEKVDERIPRPNMQQEIKDAINVTVTSATIETYAQVIIDDYKTEQLKLLLMRTVPTAGNINEQISGLIRELEDMQDNSKSTSRSLAEITEEYKGDYFTERNAKKINLGFPQLDEMIGGLEGGDMIVIGARPAVGKSALVTQIATFLSKQGYRIGFFSLEMQEKQMYERFVATESGIGVQRVRRAIEYRGNEKERFYEANTALQRHTNLIITTGSKTVSEIRSESKHAGYDLIIIDYLQLLRPETAYRGNRYAEVGAISHAIKNLAMELNIPIIALSQMNRVSEMRETKEPTMSELRESGDVEQDASLIILMWNQNENDPSRKGCKIEKQRQGVTGTVNMIFDGDKMKFQEVESDSPFV